MAINEKKNDIASNIFNCLIIFIISYNVRTQTTWVHFNKAHLGCNTPFNAMVRPTQANNTTYIACYVIIIRYFMCTEYIYLR